MKKTLGYLLLVVSCITWTSIFLMPFLDISKAQVAAATATLIVASEGLFLAALALLGKDVWLKIKSLFSRKHTPKRID